MAPLAREFWQPGETETQMLRNEAKGTQEDLAVGQVLNNSKTELPYDPAVSLPGVHPKEVKAETRTDIYTCMVRVALFPQPKIEATQVFINGSVHKPDVVHT